MYLFLPCDVKFPHPSKTNRRGNTSRLVKVDLAEKLHWRGGNLAETSMSSVSVNRNINRGFLKHTTLVIMPILASEALQHNKITKCYRKWE